MTSLFSMGAPTKNGQNATSTGASGAAQIDANNNWYFRPGSPAVSSSPYANQGGIGSGIIENPSGSADAGQTNAAPGGSQSQPFSGLVWGNGQPGSTTINENGMEQFVPGGTGGGSQYQSFGSTAAPKMSTPYSAGQGAPTQGGSLGTASPGKFAPRNTGFVPPPSGGPGGGAQIGNGNDMGNHGEYSTGGMDYDMSGQSSGGGQRASFGGGSGAAQIDGNGNWYFQPGSPAVSSSPYSNQGNAVTAGVGGPGANTQNGGGFGSGSGYGAPTNETGSPPYQGIPGETTGNTNPYGGSSSGNQFGFGSGTTESPGGIAGAQTGDSAYGQFGTQTAGTNDNYYNENNQPRTGGMDPNYRRQTGQSGQNQGSQFPNFQNLPNGAPDFMALARAQSEYDAQRARQQSQMNNPNQYGPGGSQVRTQNPDGSYSVTNSLSPDMQRNYDTYMRAQNSMLGRTNELAGGQGLSYSNVPGSPNYDPSKATSIPSADADNLAKMRDSVYEQQTQYLNPQFQQGQSDLESKLANQGIMPGSEAYQREMGNFNNAKQKAYGDARNSAIQAGGQEQSRLFGLGLQSHTAGMNDALASFNTGMAGRQQGVSETNALHNSQYNDLASLRGMQGPNLPTYGGQVGTSIPGTNFLNAANMQYNANMGVQNAEAARQAGTTNGLFGLGSSLLQMPGVQSWLGGLFNGGAGGGENISGLTPEEMNQLFPGAF